MRRLLSLIVIAVLTGCSGGGTGSESDIKEIESRIDAFYEVYSEKEIAVLDKIFSHEPDVLVFGVGASTWKGLKNVKKNIEKVLDDVDDSSIDVRDRVVKVMGKIAWFSEKGNWSYRLKGQRVDLKDMRSTGILRQEDGKWVIVQMHFSMPAGG